MEDGDCVICFEKVDDDSQKTSCCHQYMHASCKRRWFINADKHDCPFCRSTISCNEYASIVHFSCLHLACFQKDLDSVRRNILQNQSFDTDIFGRTPLHVAVESGDVDIVEELLRYQTKYEKYDLNSKTNESSGGMSALHIAVSRVDDVHENNKCYVRITTLLLEYGADVHLVDASGNTPLHLAVRDKDICGDDILSSSVISVWHSLISSGGEEAVNTLTQDGHELDLVALMKNERTLAAFLKLCTSSGIRVNVSSQSPNKKISAFGRLCLINDVVSAVTLLDSDVPVDTNSPFGCVGFNALEYASFLGYTLFVKLLLTHPKSKSQFSQLSLMRALINSMRRQHCDTRDTIIGSGLIKGDAWGWLLYNRKSYLSMRIAIEYEKIRLSTERRNFVNFPIVMSIMKRFLPPRSPLYDHSETIA